MFHDTLTLRAVILDHLSAGQTVRLRLCTPVGGTLWVLYPNHSESRVDSILAEYTARLDGRPVARTMAPTPRPAAPAPSLADLKAAVLGGAK